MSRENLRAMRGSNIENNRRNNIHCSWLILILIANVVLFGVIMQFNVHCHKQNSGCRNFVFGVSSSSLERLGALECNKVVHHHQGWRLLTCIWLHAGFIHILASSMSLTFVGQPLERQYGFVCIGTIHLLSGFGGSILTSLFIQRSISVGASGALFGLLGAKFSELIANWTSHTDKVGALFTLMLMVVINLATRILPHVGNFAHIGGFMTGFLLGLVLLLPPRLGRVESQNLPVVDHVYSKHKAYQNFLGLLAMILLITGFTVGLVMVFRGVNAYDHCHWCYYLRCIPTPIWKCDGT